MTEREIALENGSLHGRGGEGGHERERKEERKEKRRMSTRTSTSK